MIDKIKDVTGFGHNKLPFKYLIWGFLYVIRGFQWLNVLVWWRRCVGESSYGVAEIFVMQQVEYN